MARPAIVYPFQSRMMSVSGRSLLLLALFLVIGFMTIYPIGWLIIDSFVVRHPGEPAVWGFGGWQAAFKDPSLITALGNTFFLGIVRTVISLLMAIFFAWVVTRTNTPYKGLIEFMLWLGFFLPFLPMTIGWILLLDPNYGLVNRFLMSTFDLSSAPLNIYSYGGIIWAHLAFSTSIRFLLITPAFRAMDASMEEAALTLGSSSFGVLWRVTVPLLLPAILVATALGFIKSLESIEIELLLGVPSGIYVYSTKIWDYLRWEPPLFNQATALSSLFLVVILLLVWGQRMLLGRREFTTVTGRGYLAKITDLGHWRWLTFSCCALFIGIMIVLPLAVLVMGTFMRIFGYFELDSPWTLQNWTQAFDDPIFLRSLVNTLFLGVGVAVVGALFYAVISYALIRMRFTGRGLLDFLSWLPWALPGVLIGLALLRVFLGSGPLLRSLYGTLPLMILAIIIASMPLGVQVLKAGMRQIGSELEESSRVTGASSLYTFRRIVMPLLRPAVMVVGLIGFITAVREIPTVMFLSSFSSRPISLLMLDYLVGGRKERASVIGVFLVVLIIAAALVGRRLGMTTGLSDRE